MKDYLIEQLKHTDIAEKICVRGKIKERQYEVLAVQYFF